MSREIKFRTPVVCQNGHKAFWYWEPEGLGGIKNIGVPSTEKCNCPKAGLEEGYKRDGTDQQYTGLKDKNGVEIYEGDFVYIDHPCWREQATVKFMNGSFIFLSKSNQAVIPGFTIFKEKWELIVIGNIHQNPELLQ